MVLIPEDFFIRRWRYMSSGYDEFPESYRQPRYHPSNNPEGFKQFEKTFCGPNHGPFEAESRWPRIFYNHKPFATWLQTMADDRNPLSDGPPNGENTNITDVSQLGMVRHVREVIRNMVLNNLWVIDEPNDRLTEDNWQSFLCWNTWHTHMDQIRRVTEVELLQRDRQNARPGRPRPEFDWIPSFLESLDDGMNSMIAATSWALSQDQDPNTAITCALNDISEMTRLMMLLLTWEGNADHHIAKEHLFNYLYDKSVKFMHHDELADLHDRFLPGNGNISTFHEHFEFFGNLNEYYTKTSDWQRKLKDLWDFKFLFDWNWNRLWDKMYIILHPEMGISQETVQDFLDWSDGSGFVARRMFGVHPITTAQIGDELCTICLDKFSANQRSIGSLIVRLKCRHFYHVKCIIPYWDMPHFQLCRCPTCRDPAGRLWDIHKFFAGWMGDIKGYHAPRSHEIPDHYHLDTMWHKEVLDHVTQGQPISHLSKKVLSAFWRLQLEDHVYAILRMARQHEELSLEEVFG